MKKLEGTSSDSGSLPIIGYLQDFGLNEKEAKCYYLLSRLGSASAAELAGASQYNRLQTYRSIKGLLDRGLVEISLERPRRYTPLKIEHAISLLKQEAENRILQLESTTPVLLKEWAEIPDFPVFNNPYTFRIVQGSKNVFKFAMMLYESAERNIDIVIKGNELMRLVLEGADDSLEKVTNKQIAIRSMSEFDRSNIIGVRRFLEFSDLRHVPSINLAPLVLIDGREALICLTNSNNGIPENAIWTNHPQFVEMQKSLFNFLWADSKDGKSMIEKIEHKSHSSDLVE